MIVSKADPQLVDVSTLNSFDPPPAFEDSASESAPRDHIVIDLPNTYSPLGGEEPPEFTQYEAEYFETSSGDVVSHDNHLNEDGEALYRFLLSQATTFPSYRLHCRGTHQETHTRMVTQTDGQGRQTTDRETYDETITDFDFYIDLGQHIVASPIHWSIADSEPTYRGMPIHEVDSPEGRRVPTKKESRDFAAWKVERISRGLPPWIGNDHGTYDQTTQVLKSSRTLREWADDYCASNKYLKEFVYEKVVYGWNVENLRNAIGSSISASPYIGRVQVDFELQSSKIYIRSNNTLSRILSNKWLKFLSILLLVYPFIWLFKRFHHRGGGRWQVCGGAYALKHWKPVEPSRDLMNDDAENIVPVAQLGKSASASRGPRLIETERGVVWLTGLREGEWFKEWEWTIQMAVQSRFRSKEPLLFPRDRPQSGLVLDGYEP